MLMAYKMMNDHELITLYSFFMYHDTRMKDMKK